MWWVEYILAKIRFALFVLRFQKSSPWTTYIRWDRSKKNFWRRSSHSSYDASRASIRIPKQAWLRSGLNGWTVHETSAVECRCAGAHYGAKHSPSSRHNSSAPHLCGTLDSEHSGLHGEHEERTVRLGSAKLGIRDRKAWPRAKKKGKDGGWCLN